MLFFILLELQFTKLVGKIDTKASVGYELEGMQRKVLPTDGGFLPDAGGKGIGRRKSNAALFIPNLLAEGEIVGGKGRVFTLDLIPGRIEIAKELQYKGFAHLVGSIHIHSVIEAGHIAAPQAAGSDIPVKKGKIAAEIELGTNGHGAIDIQPVIIFRTHVHGYTDRSIEVYGIADGVAGIISDKRLDIVVASVIEQDDIDGAAFFERFGVGKVDVVADLGLKVWIACNNVLWITDIEIRIKDPVVGTLYPFGIGDLDSLVVLETMGKNERRRKCIVAGDIRTGGFTEVRICFRTLVPESAFYVQPFKKREREGSIARIYMTSIGKGIGLPAVVYIATRRRV